MAAADNRVAELELLQLVLALLAINLLLLLLLLKLLMLLRECIRAENGNNIFPGEFRQVCTVDPAALRVIKYASVHFSSIMIMTHNVTCRGIANL